MARSLTVYVGRRLILILPTILGIITITFIMTRMLPSDPIRAALGWGVTQEQIESLTRIMGYDKPLWYQFIMSFKNVFTGNLGISVISLRPVAIELRTRFPATFELSTIAVAITVILGVPLGVISAINENKVIDYVTRLFCFAGISTPMFWLGLLFQLVFYYHLGWLPSGGRIDPSIGEPSYITGLILVDSLLTGNMNAFVDGIRHLIMPASVLAWACMPMVTRIARGKMLEVLQTDFIMAAKSQGLSFRQVIFGRALKNTLIPVMTVIGILYGFTLGGIVIVEQIFSWPGLGTYVTESVLNMDLNPIMGVVLITSLLYCAINLVVDILYGVADPRIKYG